MDFAQKVSKIRLEGKPYDAEVEYLESTGTQYIDTGIAGTGQGYLAVRFQPLPVSDTTVYWRYFGASTGADATTRTIGVWQANPERLAVGFDNGYSASYLGPIGPIYTIDKTQYQVPTGHNGNFLIFTYNNANNMGPMRLYSFKLWNSSDQLIRDFQPVRKNGIGYLFDKVSGQLFNNQGTGAFLYGSDTKCYSVAKIEKDTLPGKPHDHRVEYIETTSNGGQYIETGLYLQSGDTVSMRASGSGTSNQCLWSARNIIGNIYYNTFTLFYLKYTSQTQGRFDYGLEGTAGSSVLNVFDFSGWSGVHEYKAVANKLYIDGTLYATGTEAQFTTGGPVRLLASESTNTPGTITNLFVGKMYGFKVIRSGKTIMDLVPVRKNGVGCLYDLVSKTLFQNAGTGTLSYGSDVPEVLWKKRPYDAEVEWLESTGEQWIDTGSAVRSTWSVSVTCSVTTTSANQTIWTARKVTGPGEPRTDWRTDSLFVINNQTPTVGRFDYGIEQTAKSFNFSGWSQVHEYKTVGGKLYIDGTQYAEYSDLDFETGGPLRIFAGENINDLGTFNVFCVGKIYSAKVLDANGATVRDLIPVRLGQVGYLYDKVSGGLFGNAGTGAFTYGSDV